MDLSTDNADDGDVERLVEGMQAADAKSQPLNCFIAWSICSCKWGQDYSINRAEHVQAFHFGLFGGWEFLFFVHVGGGIYPLKHICLQNTI